MSSSTAVVVAPRRWSGVVADYFSLTKPRIIVLLEVTTLAAMCVAAKGMPSLGLVVATLVGGFLASGGAGALNCWYDRDIDAQMARTRHRPLPSGRISARGALIFGIVLGVASFVELAVLVNLLAASLALFGYLFYVGFYTMYLKRSTIHNIVVGGAAGAMPPVVGYAAVTDHVGVMAAFLFAIIFYWTPPHFWALASLMRRDYANADVPMLPVIAGQDYTRRQVVLWTAILIPVTLLPFVTGALGAFYLFSALVLGGIFLVMSIRAAYLKTARASRHVFFYSMIYLAALFAAMVVAAIL